MLGSIIRYVLFVALVAVATWGAYHLMETPGAIVISFANYEYTLTPLAFTVLMLLGFAALWILFKLVGLLLAVYRFICGDETAISRFFNRSRERRGFDSLSRALTALAEGDGRTAKAKAEKAERLLDRPELTRLVTAQSAELSGDLTKAKKYYKALAEDKRSSYAGVKGLLQLANSDGDEERALKLAKQAYVLKPKEAWVLDNLYTLQSRSFDWAGARKTLGEQRRAGFLPKPEANRREAMLALAQSEDAEELGHTDAARRLAIEAAKLDPVNGDAVTTAARHLVASGSKRAANRLITKAWSFVPSPQLAAAFAAIEPDESPAQRADRFKKLFDVKGTGTEANLVRAELALTVEDWAEARRAMSKIEENEPSARSCAIMAAIARGEGEPDAVVRGWLAKALGAPRGADEASVLDHAAMLPLLVGEEASGSASETVTGAAYDDSPTDAEDVEETEKQDGKPAA
ncbi:heme biosynthesis protein HemY [Rhodobacteraceae bacterium NNCM2]|nr:heme biosynthesis protein HemY [Coraliihabitans acroporae]